MADLRPFLRDHLFITTIKTAYNALYALKIRLKIRTNRGHNKKKTGNNTYQSLTKKPIAQTQHQTTLTTF